jgi:hypothetical protein
MRNPNTKISKARLVKLVAGAGPHIDFAKGPGLALRRSYRASSYHSIINAITGKSVEIRTGGRYGRHDTNLSAEQALDSIRSSLQEAREHYIVIARFERDEVFRFAEILRGIFGRKNSTVDIAEDQANAIKNLASDLSHHRFNLRIAERNVRDLEALRTGVTVTDDDRKRGAVWGAVPDDA